LTIKQLSLSENALKITYGNVEFQNFPGRTPNPLLQKEGKGGREEWKRGGKGRGWGGRKARGGREGKMRKRRGRERNLDSPPPPDVPDIPTPLSRWHHHEDACTPRMEIQVVLGDPHMVTNEVQEQDEWLCAVLSPVSVRVSEAKDAKQYLHIPGVNEQLQYTTP
jgi:hypothetical protein